MLIEAGMSGDLRANGSFYRLAGFTPAQIDRFEKLMVESWVDSLAVTPAGLEAERHALGRTVARHIGR